jgi:plasmid maintenance system killer protein
LDVRFGTVELETCYRDAKVAQRAWGQKIARRYVQRVDTLHAAKAAKDLFALRALDLHPLTSARGNTLSGWMTHGAWSYASMTRA